ncbi:MAG: succinyl-diaminopimelate desuccinylase [Bradyrhizobiaceae bacterium]|nr:MAG: succinyl-diaminopimelate desuccinylase [Bradyrhizobiaceae bacterium]
MTDAVSLARNLLRCPSVTPADAGALGVLEKALKDVGFETHRVTFSEAGADDTDNLYARIGAGSPHITFAGHTDVVPPGDEQAWSHGAFAGDVKDGVLYGRGAVDMKGAIACAVAAALDYLAAHGGKPQKGTISFLITGDEEGLAVNGTVKLLEWAAKRGETFDHCLLGEPSNVNAIGDTIKVGRRGSLSGTIVVDGKQGHVAYPDRAKNPVPDIAELIAALESDPLDRGSDHFPPSNLEFISVDVGNPAWNVIPAQAKARFNIRHNDTHSQHALRTLIEERLAKAAGNRIKAHVVWEPSNADAFLTKPGTFTDLVIAAIADVTGRTPKLDTGGGTSDARFITRYCPVLEFGLVGQTMHQVDERTPLADIEMLTNIYRGVLDRYFK